MTWPEVTWGQRSQSYGVFRGHQWGYGSHGVIQGYGVISGYGSCEVWISTPPLGYKDLQSQLNQ